MNEKLKVKKDERGELFELFHLPNDGQVYCVFSEPGAIRANHYHKRKEEKFCVIYGEAKIRLRERTTNKIKEFLVSGGAPEIIAISPNSVHNIENTGKNRMILIAWTSETFNPADPDTYKEEV